VTPVSIGVEGLADAAVARRLLQFVGAEPGPEYGLKGRPHLLGQLPAYNASASYRPWLVLADLDHDNCPVDFVLMHAGSVAPYMCFRVAVRAIEAWLLADVDAIATFLAVRQGQVPGSPDMLENPKRELVNLARRSRHQRIVSDMVPRERSGRAEGPAYTSRITEFIERRWRPEVAAATSPSLRRAIACLERLASLPWVPT
jgi:hypothetical protein